MINTEKCRNCGLCGKQCKAACINMKEHEIDLSRCVACMDCIDTCKEGAISYARRYGKKCTSKCEDTNKKDHVDKGRRAFIVSSAIVGTAATMKAQEMKVDGGLAAIAGWQNRI